MVSKEFEGFQDIFNKFLQGSGTSIKWEQIEKPPKDAVQDYSTLPIPQKEEIQKMLSKLVVIKLNGGLGTSMGCRGPKSVISVSFVFLIQLILILDSTAELYTCNAYR